MANYNSSPHGDSLAAKKCIGAHRIRITVIVGTFVAGSSLMGETNNPVEVQIPRVEEVSFGADYVSPHSGIHKTLSSENVQASLYESAVRWKRVLDNLAKVKPGISREEVIRLLGKPDSYAKSPANILQYSVFGPVRPVGEDGKFVMILLDDAGTVAEVKRVEYSFGPVPEPIPLTDESVFLWRPRQRQIEWSEILRWERILDEIPRLKVGMKLQEIVDLFGTTLWTPDDPPNLLEYVKFGSYNPFGAARRPLRIEFDDHGTVVRITRPEKMLKRLPDSLSLEDLYTESEVVVLGQVKTVQEKDVGRGRKADSTASLDLMTLLKGKIPPWFSIPCRVARGADGTLVTDYEEGDVLLLFLRRDGDLYMPSVPKRPGCIGGVGPYKFGRTYRVLRDLPESSWQDMDLSEMVRALRRIASEVGPSSQSTNGPIQAIRR